MPDIIFPASPSINDTYTFGGKTWVWNGYGWQLQSTGAINNIPIGNTAPASGAFTTLSATGNISGSYLLGNGAYITGLSAPYSNANVLAYLESGTTINANFGGGNISTTGTANLGVTTVNGNLNIAGNITATGNITYIGVTDLVVTDPLIYLGANNSGDLLDIGIIGSYNDGNYSHTGFVRDHTDDTWKVFQGVTNEPNTVVDWSQAVYASFKSGAITSNASILANTTVTAVGNISGGNITTAGQVDATGNISGGNLNTAGQVVATGNITGGNISTVGSVTATGNVTSGNLNSNGTVTGVTVSATGNVTAGNLVSSGSVDVTGNVTAANIAGNYILANGAFLTGLAAPYSNANVANYLAANEALIITTTGNITTAANIAGNYFIGNGAFLTGIVAVSSYNDSNVASYLASNSAVEILSTANITTAANVAGNYFIGNGAFLTGIVAVSSYNDTNVASYLSSNSAVTILTTSNITTAANVAGDYILGNGAFLTGIVAVSSYNDSNVASYLSSNSAVTILTTSNITTSANLAGDYVLGNGAFLTGLPAGYSNSDVANYLSSNSNVTVLTTGNITTSANVSGDYILGNGAFLTGIAATSIYGNANVADYLASNANVTVTVGVGDITTQGNVAGNYFIGNGALLTGIVAVSSYNDTNVASYLASNSAVEILTTSNITSGANIAGNYILGNGAFLTGIAAGGGGNYSNANVANYLANNESITILTTGNITTSANISGAYILANGAFLTGLPATYGNANVKMYLESGATINANFGGGNITTTGTATFGPTQVNGNLNIAGNIVASGNVTYISIQDLVITDPLIYLGENNPADLQDLGIVASYTDGIYQHTGFVRDHTDDTWKVFTGVTTEPNTVVDWSQAVYAPFKSGAITSNASILANTTITAVGNITGANVISDDAIISVTANVSGNAVVGNLSTAGQIDATGNITTVANVSAAYLLGNAAFVTGLTPVWAVKSANYTAYRNDGIFANTAGNAFTVTLPATPSLGDTIYFCDSDGTWAINNLTINRNGGLIMGLSEDLVCDESNTSFSLVFNGTSWRIV